MGFKSLQFNGVSWEISLLGEDVYLLQAPSDISIDSIHSTSHAIEKLLSKQLLDIVPAYDSIALFSKLSFDQIAKRLQNSKGIDSENSIQSKKQIIPICYELGLDLKHIGTHAGLSIDAVIETHLKGTYRSLFIGFTPGFIYADGLDLSLACPRKANPRTHIEAGSIGIGGEQTGIYSLNSPGGWNIIGQTPMKLFDHSQHPPMKVEVGTTFSFKQISKEEFESWAN